MKCSKWRSPRIVTLDLWTRRYGRPLFGTWQYVRSVWQRIESSLSSNLWRGRHLLNQEYCYCSFFSTSGIRETFNWISIRALSGQVYWNVGWYRRCVFYHIFLRTLRFYHFPPCREFLYRQLRPSDLWRRQTVDGHGIFEKNILMLFQDYFSIMVFLCRG